MTRSASRRCQHHREPRAICLPASLYTQRRYDEANAVYAAIDEAMKNWHERRDATPFPLRLVAYLHGLFDARSRKGHRAGARIRGEREKARR